MQFTSYIENSDSTESEIRVSFDYQPREKATRDYPGCDPEIWITSVMCDLREIMPTLDDDTLDRLEAKAWEEAGERASFESSRDSAMAEDRLEFERESRVC